jgi:hypothetical protein
VRVKATVIVMTASVRFIFFPNLKVAQVWDCFRRLRVSQRKIFQRRLLGTKKEERCYSLPLLVFSTTF